MTSARPKPLTDDELARLEREGHTFGLPSGETRRLVSEVRRLRQLVAVAREHVEPGPATCPSCADTVKRILDDGPDAVPSTRAHNIKTCPVLKTELSSGKRETRRRFSQGRPKSWGSGLE